MICLSAWGGVVGGGESGVEWLLSVYSFFDLILGARAVLYDGEVCFDTHCIANPVDNETCLLMIVHIFVE